MNVVQKVARLFSLVVIFGLVVAYSAGSECDFPLLLTQSGEMGKYLILE